jgi:IS30 family transposase
MPKPLDSVTEDRVADLTCQGWSADQIAREVGIHPRTVTRVRRRTGVGGPVYPHYSDEELRIAEQMLADGASIADTARTLGREPTTLWKRYKGRGWSSEKTAEYRRMLRELKRLENA